MGEREQPRIVWEQAEVHDGELQVPIEERAPHGWAARFRSVLGRLAPDGEERWGEISVSRREIKVAGVQEGGEADLRHLLDSILQQVNADVLPEPDPEEEPSPERLRDERMTEAFRGFGAPEG